MKLKKFLEASLPAGFEGFGDDEITPPGKVKVDKDKFPDDIQRDSIVKIKNTKWLVMRRVSEYTLWVYKHPSKKRKLYEIVSIKNGNFQVWLTGGSGQRLENKPIITGKLK